MVSGAGLRVESLGVTFPDATAPAVDDMTLEVPPGSVLALLGPSGCGKSTVLRAVAGLQRSTGRVLFDGVDLTRTPVHRRGFALMFQDGQLFGQLNVFENVAYGLRRRGASRAEITTRVEELLHLVGLAGFGERRPSTLSGGQQQRVALARAVASRPRLLLLDEPLSALDRSLRERLALDLREVLEREGITALFVTHDHDEALTVADDMALMRAGRIVQSGPTESVWRAPADVEAAHFLGYATVLSAAEAVAVGLPARSWALRRTAWHLLDETQRGRPDAALARVTRVARRGDHVDVGLSLAALGGRHVEATLPASAEVDRALATGEFLVAADASRGAVLPGDMLPGEGRP